LSGTAALAGKKRLPGHPVMAPLRVRTRSGAALRYGQQKRGVQVELLEKPSRSSGSSARRGAVASVRARTAIVSTLRFKVISSFFMSKSPFREIALLRYCTGAMDLD